MSNPDFALEGAHAGGIWSLAVTEDNYYISGSSDQTVKIWNTESKLVQTLKGHYWGVTSLSYSAATRRLAVSSLDSRIRVWKANKDHLFTAEFTIDASPIDTWSVAFNPEGNKVAATSKTGNANLWNIATGEKEITYETGSSKFTTSISYSSDGRLLAVGAIDGAVSIFESETGKKLDTTIEGGSLFAIRSLAFSPDSKHLLIGSDDNQIYLYEAENLSNRLANFSGHSSFVLSVCWSPDGNTFVSGSSDKKVKVWDVASRKVLQSKEKHQDKVWAVVYNSSGSEFASGSDDKSIVFHSS